MTTILFSFLCSFIITFFAIPPIIRVSIIRGFYDKPDDRKAHRYNTPTLGGISIFAGFIISSVFWTTTIMAREGQYLFVSMIIMFIIGMKDDIVPLSPMKKLIGQIIAVAIIVLFANIRIRSLYGFAGIYDLNPYVDIALSMLFLLTIINAYNFIDGIDGLAAGIGAIITLTFGICFFAINDIVSATISFSLLGALLAFLKYNYTPARIFMGDTGSLISGLAIGVLTLRLLGDDGQMIPHYAKIHAAVGNPINFVLAVLIIPLADTIRIFFVRLMKKRSPFLPDRNHIHHLLVALGLSHIKSSMILYAVNILFIVLCLGLKDIHQNWVLLILIVTAWLFSQLLYLCKAQKQVSNELLQPKNTP